MEYVNVMDRYNKCYNIFIESDYRCDRNHGSFCYSFPVSHQRPHTRSLFFAQRSNFVIEPSIVENVQQILDAYSQPEIKKPVLVNIEKEGDPKVSSKSESDDVSDRSSSLLANVVFDEANASDFSSYKNSEGDDTVWITKI